MSALSGTRLPVADLYCLGGGEDAPEVSAADLLHEDGTLARAAAGGAVVLGVSAGYQLLGHTFPDHTGRVREGLGLLDVDSAKGTGRRAVGELLADVIPPGPRSAGGPGLPPLTGFENHGAVTTLGAGVTPLARVVRGVGNGDGSGTEGAWSGRVVGTYLHGPVLARNAVLADVLLGWVLEARGSSVPLEPLDDTEESALRAERMRAPRADGRVRVMDRLLRR